MRLAEKVVTTSNKSFYDSSLADLSLKLNFSGIFFPLNPFMKTAISVLRPREGDARVKL